VGGARRGGEGYLYVRAYDREGAVIWTRRWGTSTSDSATGVAVGPRGDVFVVGSFLGCSSVGTDAYVHRLAR